MDDQQRRLQANIPKILLLNFFYMFLVIIPVIVPYWQMHGLSMSDIYLLQSIFAISVVILEVPSGYISDLLGRKNTIVAAGIFSGTAYSIFMMSESFAGFCTFEITMSIAVSLISGTDVALIYDSIELLEDRKFNQNRILGKKVFYSQIGETIAALIGGAAAAVSLYLPAQINAVTAWMPFVIGLTLFEPPRQLMDRQKHAENIRYIYRSLFQHSKLLTFIILNLVIYGVATLLAVWAYQGYWQSMDIPLSWFGYLWAGFNLTVALSGRAAHIIEEKLGSTTAILLIALLPVAGYLGMAMLPGLIGVAAGLLFQFSRGLNQVVLRDALNSRVKADMRATANSVASLGVRLAFAGIGPFLGWGIDAFGYGSAFEGMGWLYVALFFVICLPLLSQRKFFKPAGS
ncbi:MAG: MFS transporter [Calditrichia bacterium]|nr:MFS transporter [Calditrichota bacterium]MCB0268353.1 MFS transporter [Calditrichota bacterium]MCB9066708.1 MFS transporter [Calditrichia bacterium]